jgi:radical SAM superfamily enzyme YgiQ (UPF0313 family)
MWQDHGLGLLRTILKRDCVETDVASTRLITSWDDLPGVMAGYDMLLMNVRSYTFAHAKKAARAFKKLNPKGIVIVGGMHATVDLDSMLAIDDFDHVCTGPGEKVITDLVMNHESYDRKVVGPPSGSMADWPMIDRTLWPQERVPGKWTWPLEPDNGWARGPIATIITSRVCPWRCSFCNEASYIPQMERRPVDAVIDELNYLDNNYGPLGSVVIHDSMFFQNPVWLKEWHQKYPTRTNRPWPYWAAGRSDTVRRWPDLFEALVLDTNWRTVSIGFESGSDNVLKTLNKECTIADNHYTIELLNKLGRTMASRGRPKPRFWANIMLGIPGETKEEAFKTVRMVHAMDDPHVAMAYYAPFPGSVLGHQLIAEGKSLLGEGHDRFAGSPKVKGVDYKFYDDLLAGRYQRSVMSTPWP